MTLLIILLQNEESVLSLVSTNTELIYSWTRHTWTPGFWPLAKGSGIYDMLVQDAKLPNSPSDPEYNSFTDGWQLAYLAWQDGLDHWNGKLSSSEARSWCLELNTRHNPCIHVPVGACMWDASQNAYLYCVSPAAGHPLSLNKSFLCVCSVESDKSFQIHKLRKTL